MLFKKARAILFSVLTVVKLSFLGTIIEFRHYVPLNRPIFSPRIKNYDPELNPLLAALHHPKGTTSK